MQSHNVTQNSAPWYLKTKSLNAYKNLYMYVNCGSVAPISPSKRKQPKFPLAGEWTNKAGHSYRMKYYSAIKMRWPNMYYKVDKISKHSVTRQRPETENWWLSKLSIWEKWKWKFPFGALQMLSTGLWQWSHHSAMRKLSNYTLCGWIVWYVNYISIKLLKRISKTSVFFD